MELEDFPTIVEYCEHLLKVKDNQAFAIRAGFCDEQVLKWGDTQESMLNGVRTYTNSAQVTLDDAQNGVSLMACEVCHKPISTRAVWCIHCGHPQPISNVS